MAFFGFALVAVGAIAALYFLGDREAVDAWVQSLTVDVPTAVVTPTPWPTAAATAAPGPTATPTPFPAATPTSTPLPTVTRNVYWPTPRPTPEGARRYWARLNCTGSMEPTITCEDRGLVEPDFAPEDIQVGTIILFKGAYIMAPVLQVVHRVVEVQIEPNPPVSTESYRYRTQGDANPIPDSSWVPYKAIQGILVGVRRSGELIEL